MFTFAEKDRIQKTYGLPSYVTDEDMNVKVASLRDYADPLTRKYPTHTKAACYMSNARFWDNAPIDDKASTEVGQRLLKMAEFWGITQDIRSNILEKVSQSAHQVFTDSDYAIVSDLGSESVRLYPIVDSDTVKLAAVGLYNQRCNLPLAWRTQGAKRILEKSAQLKVEFDTPIADYLDRAAGNGITPAKELASVLYKRAMLLADKKMSKESAAMKQTSEVIKQQKSGRDLCVKVAQILDSVDTESGLYKRYGKDLKLPEEECHTILQKHAAVELDKYVSFPGGSTYLKEDISRVNPSFTDKDNLDETPIEKIASCVSRLSVTEAMQAERELLAHGLRPVELPYALRN